jgi:hypothetical protein
VFDQVSDVHVQCVAAGASQLDNFAIVMLPCSRVNSTICRVDYLTELAVLRSLLSAAEYPGNREIIRE